MNASLVDSVFAEAASETLLAESHEQVEAEIAEGRLRKVLQTPNVMTIVFHVLNSFGFEIGNYSFLVACTRLYTSLCRSVCQVFTSFFEQVFNKFSQVFNKFSPVFTSFHKFSQVFWSKFLTSFGLVLIFERDLTLV